MHDAPRLYFKKIAILLHDHQINGFMHWAICLMHEQFFPEYFNYFSKKPKKLQSEICTIKERYTEIITGNLQLKFKKCYFWNKFPIDVKGTRTKNKF